MKYVIYKFVFSTGVHLGNGRLSKSRFTFCADTLFSALCHMTLKINGEAGIEQLVEYAKKGMLLISDSMPYINDTLYLPKPIVEIPKENRDASVKKQAKKLAYISEGHFSDYLKGNLDIGAELEQTEILGNLEIRTRLNKHDDTGPYQVGVFHYGRNKQKQTGSYIIIGYKEDFILDLVEELLYYLGYEGIGGKISSGLGKFEPIYEEPSENLVNHLKNADQYPYRVTLSLSLPTEEELPEALSSAYYAVILRSGFVASYTYAETFQKKKDLYCIKAGSCVCSSYQGDVYDVSNGGRHPVYRYAKPMFMGVEI